MSMVLSPQHLSNVNPTWDEHGCITAMIESCETLLGMSMVLSPQHLSNVNPTWDEHGSITAMFE
jgi:hypothetical protein